MVRCFENWWLPPYKLVIFVTKLDYYQEIFNENWKLPALLLCHNKLFILEMVSMLVIISFSSGWSGNFNDTIQPQAYVANWQVEPNFDVDFPLSFKTISIWSLIFESNLTTMEEAFFGVFLNLEKSSWMENLDIAIYSSLLFEAEFSHSSCSPILFFKWARSTTQRGVWRWMNWNFKSWIFIQVGWSCANIKATLTTGAKLCI